MFSELTNEEYLDIVGEMPKEKPKFTLHVSGKSAWSWADIEPNSSFIEGK